MKENVNVPPRSKAITNSIERLHSQIRKRLSVQFIKNDTRKNLLQNMESLRDIINEIAVALGIEQHDSTVEKNDTNARLDRIENTLVDISKQCIEYSNKQTEQTTIKRTITTVQEEITNASENTNTITIEKETASYRSQFVKSFGNRIFEAQKATEKNQSEYQCIKDLLNLLNSYVFYRFRKQYPEIGIYTYSLEQMQQYTIIIILKYASEYSRSEYNAKMFVQEMQEWISKIGVDEKVTLEESLPKCLHKFDVEKDIQISATVMYIWWIVTARLHSAKRTSNETINFDNIFDFDYADNLAEKLDPELYYELDGDLNSYKVDMFIK